MFSFSFPCSKQRVSMEDLSRQWSCLSLSEKEGDDICFKQDRCRQEFIIAALFLTRRALNMDAVGRTFKPLWRAQNGFKISNEGGNKVLFVFDKEEEVDRILSTGPWSFDKSLVVLQRYKRHSALEELSFDKVSFWVQVHNIPISYRSRSVAEDICDGIGRVDRTTDISECECGNYIRVRVTIDVFQPLCRGRVIRLEDNEKVWVTFRYERLPNFCYWCGCLDHGDKECDLWIQSKGNLQKSSQQYGSWLRATSSGASKGNVIHVSGYYEDRKENLSSRWRRTENQRPSPMTTPAAANTTEKESEDMEADFGEIPNSNMAESTFKKESSKSISQDHDNHGISFTQKLKEIDNDLGIYENPGITGQPEDNQSDQEISPPFDLGRLRNDLDENLNMSRAPTLVPPLEKKIVSPLSDITNSQTPRVNTVIPHQATWKRVPRPAHVIQSPSSGYSCLKRPIDRVDDRCELPSKKLVVSSNDRKIPLVLAEAVVQPRQSQ